MSSKLDECVKDPEDMAAGGLSGLAREQLGAMGDNDMHQRHARCPPALPMVQSCNPPTRARIGLFETVEMADYTKSGLQIEEACAEPTCDRCRAMSCERRRGRPAAVGVTASTANRCESRK